MMGTIQQLSIFLENKSGRLNQILDILSGADINIIAATVADTSEYGILRMVTSDNQKAIETLKSGGVSANISQVLAIDSSSDIASFAKDLRLLAEGGVDIEYMYCFSTSSKTILLIRASDLERAVVVAKECGVKLLDYEHFIER